MAALAATLGGASAAGRAAPPLPVHTAYFYKPPLDGTSATFLARHFQLLILSRGDESYLAALRRAAYTGPVLQYIILNEAEGPGPYANSAAACDRDFPPYAHTTVEDKGEFCRDVHPHEDWFLHNRDGARLYSHYQSANGVWRTNYQMNPAAPGWRRLVLQRLHQYRGLGFDGFFLDNVDLSRDGLLRDPANHDGVAEFADDPHYRAAEAGFVAAVRAAFPGFPLWANLTHDPGDAGGWATYLPTLDGVMVEDFALGWQTYQMPPMERAHQRENIGAALAQGKDVLAVEQGRRDDLARLQVGLEAYRSLVATAPTRAARPGTLYFRYADAFDQDYRTVWWYAAYGAP